MTCVVHPSVSRQSTFSNIFFSETTKPTELKCHMETPKNGRMKVCPNGPGHMTNMATTPIYGKTPLKSSLENQNADDHGAWYVALVMYGLLSLFK